MCGSVHTRVQLEWERKTTLGLWGGEFEVHFNLKD